MGCFGGEAQGEAILSLFPDGAKITVTFQVAVGAGTAGSTLTNTVSLSSTQMSAPFTDTATVGVPLCFAETNGDNTTDFASVDAQAVQAAIDAASSGGTVKLAGTSSTTREPGICRARAGAAGLLLRGVGDLLRAERAPVER